MPAMYFVKRALIPSTRIEGFGGERVFKVLYLKVYFVENTPNSACSFV